MSFRAARFIIIFAGILLSFLLLNILPNLTFNNDHWLPQSNEYQQMLDYLEDEFQPGFGAIVVLTLPTDYFDQTNIDFFKSFKSSIEQLQYVFKVNSPLDATVIINQDDMLSIQTYEEAIDENNIRSIDHYKSLFTKSPYFGKLLSTDYKTVGLSISIDKKNDSNDLERRVSTIQAIQGIISNLPPPVTAFISGDAAIYYQMDHATQRNLVTLLPIAFALLILISWLFLKQWRSVLIVIIPTIVNLGIVPIVITMLGHTITIINVTLFVLVLVISVADGIHMLNYWERFIIEKVKYPIAQTIQSTWLPCFITSISTAVGFGSFVTSSIIPLHQYGIQSFIVMLFSYIVVMSVVPVLLTLLPPIIRQKEDIEFFPETVQKLSSIIVYHPKKIAIGCLICTIAIAQGLWFSTTETSFISVFFKKNHPVQQNVRFVDEYLLGSGRVDIILPSNQQDTFKKIETFNTIDELSTKAESLRLVKGTHDIRLPVRLIHKGFNNNQTQYPTTDQSLEQELLFLEFSRGETKTDVLSSVVDFDYKNSRIEFITHQLPTSKIKHLIRDLSNVFSDWPHGKIIITGSQFLSYILGEYILESQMVTVAITFLFIWLLFITLYGPKLGTIGMIPNIVPMIITLSLIPLASQSFDFATVLISSITLGLCVDDTIHWLHYFTICKKNNWKTPAIQTSVTMFKPLLFTTVILGAGFGVLAIADLVILKKFGIFTTIAIFLAFLADIFILPAALRSVKMAE